MTRDRRRSVGTIVKINKFGHDSFSNRPFYRSLIALLAGPLDNRFAHCDVLRELVPKKE